jgi:hypothetical protein
VFRLDSAAPGPRAAALERGSTALTRTRGRAGDDNQRLVADRKIAREGRLTILILAAAWISVCAPFWPGLVHWDTAQIVGEAHHGPIVDWWSFLGTLGLRLWFDVGLGQGLLWAAAIGGLFGCSRVVLRPVPAACATLAMTIFPPDYGQLSTFSRDTAYISFSLLSVAALGGAARTAGRYRNRWLLVAFACSVLATISRQNGLVGLVVVVLFALLHGRRITWSRAAVAGLAGVVAAGASYGLVSAAGSVLGARSVHPERAIYVYDLAALSVHTDTDLFPQAQLELLGAGGAAPSDVSLPALQKSFRPFNEASVGGLTQTDYANAQMASREDAVLRRAWISAVVHHPAGYLAVRLRVTLSTVGLGDRGPDVAPYGPDFAYQEPEGANFGHPLRFPAAVARAGVVLGWFVGPNAAIPLDLLWIYLVVGVAAVIIGWRRKRDTALLSCCLMLGAALNLVVLFFTTMAAGYRYCNLVPPVAILVTIYALGGSGMATPDSGPKPIES